MNQPSDPSADESKDDGAKPAEENAAASSARPVKPQPVPRKIPEPQGNLTRRSNWFQRRSGH